MLGGREEEPRIGDVLKGEFTEAPVVSVHSMDSLCLRVVSWTTRGPEPRIPAQIYGRKDGHVKRK